MREKDRDTALLTYTQELKKDFERWDYLFRNGGSDPFWPDGVNLNLVRNHIIYDKRKICEIVESEENEMSFFGLSYPDIYHRETPEKVPEDYMVKADEIRQRANEQIALYEADPNFLFILENHPKVFQKGETVATRKAGLSIYHTSGFTHYRKDIEDDKLVAMRRDFHEPYEQKAVKWAEYAARLKAFLEAEHNPEDNTVVHDEPEEDDLDTEILDVEPEEVPVREPPRKPSLDQQISGASMRKNAQEKQEKPREEQISFF